MAYGTKPQSGVWYDEDWWAELEDEDFFPEVDEGLEDDEISAAEAAFMKGYVSERRLAQEED